MKKKKDILISLSNDLKKINEYYIIGDIRNSNIMIGESDAKIIDWENGTPIKDDLNIFQFYSVAKVPKIYVDSLKLFISSISLLYEIDFEFIIHFMSLEDIYSNLKIDYSALKFLDDQMNAISRNNGEVIYFGKYIKDFSDVHHDVRQRIIKSCDKYIYSKIF